VYTIHGIHAGHGVFGWLKLAVERCDRNKVAAYISTCKADFDQGAQMGILASQKSTVIYNGIPDVNPVTQGLFRAELGLDPDIPLVLHVGRATHPKNHPMLLKAFEDAHNKTITKPILVMIVAGSEKQRMHLHRQASQLSCSKNILIIEPRASLDEAYTDANLFVLSSLWEARPYVLVEAMQHGCSVISTDVGGVSEVVTDEVDGLLVPSQNSRAFGSAIVQLLDNDEMRMRMGREAKHNMTGRFTLDAMVEQTLEVYSRVMSAGQ
jgi:glycosyltransferase involved in cell wall biosynthesis